MTRIPALATTVLCLAGCFVFDNPYDSNSSNSPPSIPTAEFEIVVSGASYSGTYVWSAADNAYSAVIGLTTYHVYMDNNGYWVLSYLYNWNHLSGGTWGTSPVYGPLPPTNGGNWSPGGVIFSVDDSAGGICSTPVAPDSPVQVGDTLQVTFKSSDPQDLATYQWERSSSPDWLSSVPVGTGSTYALTSSDFNKWIRVVITPTDGTSVGVGSPVSSPPVYVPN
jgi:hypothetical protein